MTSIGFSLFLQFLQNPAHTHGEKIRLWRGKFFKGTSLWNAQLSADLTSIVTRPELPVYFQDRVHNYTVSCALARRYFDQRDAPKKGFYTLEHSAQSPLFEEPDRLRKIMLQNLLEGRNALADM